MIEYSLARLEEDSELRGLLRTPGMSTWVDMTLEREPSFFAGSGTWGQEYPVVARHRGELVGMFTCTRQNLYFNGQPTPVTYLGGLRIPPAWRHRISVLKGGFASIPRWVPPSPVSITSIARDNQVARRLLEAGVPGLPVYRPLAPFSTLAVASSRGRPGGQWNPLRPEDVAELLEFHRLHNQGIQFAPVLDEEMVERVGPGNFRVWRERGRLQACVALWNQQSVRQLVGRRYAPWVRRLRHLYNWLGQCLGWVPLPPEGGQLDQTFLAFSTFLPGVPAQQWLRHLLCHCPTRVAVMGGTLLASLATFELKTQIYQVGEGPPLFPAPLQPEAALL